MIFAENLSVMIKTSLVLMLDTNDEVFSEKLKAVFLKHFSNQELDVALFCEAMQMSRTHLHRKIKEATKMSTTEFIREQRLIVAADIICYGRFTIKEVCLSVGFKDLSYFSKCFKQKYGVPPSEFVRYN